MIWSWILIILLMVCGIVGAIMSIVCCDSNLGKVGLTAAILIVAIGLSGVTFWHLYYTESGKREQKTFQSEIGGGLYRVVKVYDMQGEQIAEYKGKFDVEEQQTEGVTKIKFDLDGERHIIYCSTGTVIIDETQKGGEE